MVVSHMIHKNVEQGIRATAGQVTKGLGRDDPGERFMEKVYNSKYNIANSR
jgi:hypothetical protein